jgi:hypothetical protein
MSGFREEWFPWQSCDALAGFGHQVRALQGAVVEVGCWEGRSTCALARAVYPDKVHAVDTWQGSPGELSAELAAEPGRDVYLTFLDNVARYTKGNVEIHVADWRDVFAEWDQPIKLIHIDATHTYGEVRDNIVAVRPYVVAGGIICGDDAHDDGVKRAVLDVFGDANVVATLWWVQA